jgi:transposase-like protein
MEWKRYDYRRNTEAFLRKTFEAMRAEFSTSSETVGGTHFKPGGTVTAVLEKWANLDVEISAFYHILCIKAWIYQINNAISKLNDVIKQVTQLRSEFEVDLATAVIENKHTRFRQGEDYDTFGK